MVSKQKDDLGRYEDDIGRFRDDFWDDFETISADFKKFEQIFWTIFGTNYQDDFKKTNWAEIWRRSLSDFDVFFQILF